MKKILTILLCSLLFMVSCNKDDLVIEPEPKKELIFEMTITKIVDGQDIYFNVNSTESHTLLITQNNSVITKETFTPLIGLNSRKIYTKSLPKGLYLLKLYSNQSELNSVQIILE